MNTIPEPSDMVHYMSDSGRALEARVVEYRYGTVVLERNGQIITRQRSELS